MRPWTIAVVTRIPIGINASRVFIDVLLDDVESPVIGLRATVPLPGVRFEIGKVPPEAARQSIPSGCLSSL
jgi:hypothetical protein